MSAPCLQRARRMAPGAALAAVLLASCSSAPTRVFTLDPVPPARSSGYAGPAIRVDAVHMPPALDRTEMMARVAPGEFKIEDLDEWSASLGQLARQALSADLVARLPAGRTIFPHLEKPPGALGLTVDVLDFSAGAGGAYLQASWVIASSAAPLTGTVELHTELAGGGTGPAVTARALSELLGRLADRIVAGLPAASPPTQ